MVYNSFNSVFASHPKVDEAARRAYTADWLQEMYGIALPEDSQFVDELTRVHDHDNQPLHFGQLKLPSSLTNLWVRLVRVNGIWLLGVAKDEEGAQVTILPANGFEVPDMVAGVALLDTVRSLLGSAKGRVVHSSTISVTSLPKPAPNKNVSEKYGRLEDDAEDHSRPDTSSSEDLLLNNTRSINIL